MASEQQQATKPTLDELFKGEPDRLSRLSFEVAGLYFDWSKTHLDEVTIARSIDRAKSMRFDDAREALAAEILERFGVTAELARPGVVREV